MTSNESRNVIGIKHVNAVWRVKFLGLQKNLFLICLTETKGTCGHPGDFRVRNSWFKF